MKGSACDHFLVSFPHPFPEQLETVLINDIYVSFWWLLPITSKEARYAEKHGVEALEELLEKKKADVLDIKRRSVISVFWA
jgi:hypothetical protein